MSSTDKKETFHVGPDEAGQTLAAALRRWYPDHSWSQVRGLLKRRQVLVNGNLCPDDGRRLKVGEVVSVLPQSAPKPPGEDDLKVRFWDDSVAIVEKPAGVTSTRHSEERSWNAKRKNFQPTLDEMLPPVLAKLGAKRSRRGGLPPVRPVHRLDRDTSGLMAFALSQPAERVLAEQFRSHTTHRRYLAVCWGRVRRQTIESMLIRDRGDGRRGSDPAGKAGKRAVTHVEPIEDLGGYTLVRCQLETGRTHQIRIHLAEKGHPVCGDRVYRGPMGKPPIPDESGAPRLALHAAELGITHPRTGREMHFEMALPEELLQLLERLRRSR